MTVEVAKARCCPACNTPLSREGGSEGLCPGCLLELALDDTSFEAEVLADPEEARYEEAMQEYFTRTPQKLKTEGTSYPGREELHDRDRLR